MYQQYSDIQNQFMPFQCTICGKGFKSRGGLSFHMEAHKGRQFVCPVCDFKFKHKHHMKNHLVNVHKLLLCPICFTTFRPDQVREHTVHILACKK
uniref:C2H2-type domain-containing protein n=2 Tax=Arion vulgaris TaxID=1028688 RepID=A0A0B7BDF6_9EUPU